MSSGEYVIETTGLTKRFGGAWAVKDLDLRVPRGCVYGFLGLNGAGKTTTIRMLMGLLQPTGGGAQVMGFDPAVRDVEVKRRVGYVPDTPNFYEWMLVRELIAFVAHHRRDTWDDGHAAHLLKVFNLPCDQRLRTLSKGQRAKLNLLLGLAFKPDLLILDEPTLGLDPVARRQFVEGVLAEYMEGGRTVFVSSHLINEISGLVDHVGIIHDGSMIRSEPTESLLARVKRVRLVYDGQVPAQFDCTGLLHSRANGREAVLVLDGYEPERARAELARLGAAGVEVEDLNLEEAFIELVGRRGEVEHE